mmetsp:Transcript_32954/g.45979  ORF Transcript_32954/g.45979 Transcript_32954/m.45979 type:complete len:253 (+) Transcript_32954:53-811(+)
MEWSLERSEQFVDTMRIMLAGYDQDPSARYPTTIEQTARCLNALPKEQAESALRDFSKSAREAVQVMQRKLAEGIITSTPSIDKSIRRTPYRTPSRKKSVHWIQYVDEKTQRAYYENQLTGETTWECPKSQFKIDGQDFVEWEEDAFTEEEFLVATKRAFDMVDQDKNGMIEERELKDFLAKTNKASQFDDMKQLIPKIRDLGSFRAFWDAVLDAYGTTRCLELFKQQFSFSITPEVPSIVYETPETSPTKP